MMQPYFSASSAKLPAAAQYLRPSKTRPSVIISFLPGKNARVLPFRIRSQSAHILVALNTLIVRFRKPAPPSMIDAVIQPRPKQSGLLSPAPPKPFPAFAVNPDWKYHASFQRFLNFAILLFQVHVQSSSSRRSSSPPQRPRPASAPLQSTPFRNLLSDVSPRYLFDARLITLASHQTCTPASCSPSSTHAAFGGHALRRPQIIQKSPSHTPTDSA